MIVKRKKNSFKNIDYHNIPQIAGDANKGTFIHSTK